MERLGRDSWGALLGGERNAPKSAVLMAARPCEHTEPTESHTFGANHMPCDHITMKLLHKKEPRIHARATHRAPVVYQALSQETSVDTTETISALSE